MMTEIKKKRRIKKSIIKLISIVVIGVSIYLLFGVASDIYGVISLKNEASVASEELQKLKDENATLTSKRNKLEDPDYVQTYARGNYMFSKDGEKIFYLPANNTTSPDVTGTTK